LSNNAIREVTPGGVVTTPYGRSFGFNTPNGIALDPSNNQNNLYVADTGNNDILKISGGAVSSFSSGVYNSPESVAVDTAGNVYVADTGNNAIRKITSAGVASTLAGQPGTAGFADGNATTTALFNAPSAVAVDGSGNVYVADFGNSVIRKISGGMVSTVAGQAGVGGYLDGPGATALFNTPSGVTVDAAGNIYVTDCLVPALATNAGGNDLVRRISPAGVVSTLAGQAGNVGSADGTGTAAQFYSVQALALNQATGTFYFADTYNDTIRLGTILPLPTLSLTATQPVATVFGPVPGVFTVTRTGGDPTVSVTADYASAGASTAIASTDYPILPGTVTIPAGATTATIAVNPIEDGQATNGAMLQLMLNPSVGYNLGSPTTAIVTIEEITPYQTWATSVFGANAINPLISSETADPSSNGLPNLLAYAFASDPLQTGTTAAPVVTTIPGSDGQEHLAITFNQLNNAPNLTYTVQVTSDLTGLTDQWHSGPTYTTVVGTQAVNSTVTRVTVIDNAALSTVSRRFIRVQVNEN
jgi:sugar lactone lactonase YvrE